MAEMNIRLRVKGAVKGISIVDEHDFGSRTLEKNEFIELHVDAVEMPREFCDQLHSMLGEFGDMAVDKIYRLSMLKALQDAIA